MKGADFIIIFSAVLCPVMCRLPEQLYGSWSATKAGKWAKALLDAGGDVMDQDKMWQQEVSRDRLNARRPEPLEDDMCWSCLIQLCHAKLAEHLDLQST